jgi:ParB family chromosome partitioning protein
MQLLPLALIDANPYQPRTVFHEAALQELVTSIEEHGVLQPIIVRPRGERYQLVSGERRTLAARRAGLNLIPAVVQSYDNRRMLEVAIVENVQREDIGPLEAAEAYKRLMEEFGMTQAQVAPRVGKSRPAIAHALRLLKLPAAIRESLARGEITEGHARSLLSIPDPEWQERVWRRILDENLSVRTTEGLASPTREREDEGEEDDRAEPARRGERVSRETSGNRPEKPRDASLDALEGRLRLLLGTRVRISGTAEGGSIAIDYYSADDLQRIAALLGLSG